MKGVLKAVIAGIIIIAVGAAILIGTLAYNGWSFKRPNFQTAEYGEYTGNEIEIELDAGKVKTRFYDGESVTLEYPVSNAYETDISAEDGVLRYRAKRKAFSFGRTDVPDTVIYLPSNAIFNIKLDVGAGSAELADGEYGNVVIDVAAGNSYADSISCGRLEIGVNAGSVQIKNLKCAAFKCDMNMGNVEVKKLDCANAEIEVDMGEMNLALTGDKSDYGISAKVGMGQCNVSSQTGSTDKTLNLDVDMGEINVTFNS